ncbi:MAG: twin-arginine translocation pathway signal protein [Nitrospinota bacterium]
MDQISRRDFLREGTQGLAAWGAGGLLLMRGASPTEASGEPGADGQLLAALGERAEPRPPAPTERVTLGPFYRQGAPFRAKVTPPLEPGPVLVIRGRVWGHDTGQPLPGAVLDVWQADAAGRYSGGGEDFGNRARMRTDESGRYEFETIRPGGYRAGAFTRAGHIHCLVRHPGYPDLVTQIFFAGDPLLAGDPLVKPSLTIPLRRAEAGGRPYETGTFDIVLARG